MKCDMFHIWKKYSSNHYCRSSLTNFVSNTFTQFTVDEMQLVNDKKKLKNQFKKRFDVM